MIRQWHISRKLAWLLCLAAVWAAVSVAVVPRSTWAQDGEKAEKPAATEEKKAEGAEKAAPVQRSTFMWIIESSGWIGAFILLCSIYFVAQVSRLFYEFRLPVVIPPEIVGRCEDLLAQRDFKNIYNVLKDDDSFFSRTLSTGIAELPNGLAEARDVMERVGESITVEMEKKISILAVLGTLGPMIGLIGTLKGMIGSFSVIALSDTQMKASEVAKGISEALILTFEGVFLSIPAIYFFSVFRNRVSTLTTTAMLEADQFLRHFAHAARSKAPAGGAAATTAKVAKPAE
jgi:biopolymer transport protein ExbB